MSTDVGVQFSSLAPSIKKIRSCKCFGFSLFSLLFKTFVPFGIQIVPLSVYLDYAMKLHFKLSNYLLFSLSLDIMLSDAALVASAREPETVTPRGNPRAASFFSES